MVAVKATEGIPFPPFREEATVTAVAIQSIRLESVLALAFVVRRGITFVVDPDVLKLVNRPADRRPMHVLVPRSLHPVTDDGDPVGVVACELFEASDREEDILHRVERKVLCGDPLKLVVRVLGPPSPFFVRHELGVQVSEFGEARVGHAFGGVGVGARLTT